MTTVQQLLDFLIAQEDKTKPICILDQDGYLTHVNVVRERNERIGNFYYYANVPKEKFDVIEIS